MNAKKVAKIILLKLSWNKQEKDEQKNKFSYYRHHFLPENTEQNGKSSWGLSA